MALSLNRITPLGGLLETVKILALVRTRGGVVGPRCDACATPAWESRWDASGHRWVLHCRACLGDQV